MADIHYKKAGDVFNQHSYWTKQPVDAIAYYIEKYTKQNDLVLDPFSGSGMTGIASQLTGRRSILSDLSPAAIHITRGYNQTINFSKQHLDDALSKIYEAISPLYKTACVKCGCDVEIRYQIIGEVYRAIDDGELYSDAINQFEAIKSGNAYKSPINHKTHTFDHYKTIKYCYVCTCQKEKFFKDLDKKDLLHLKEIDGAKKDFPNDLFFGKEAKRNLKKKIFKVKDLYSSRNLLALNRLLGEIKKNKNQELKTFLLFNFSSILFNCSLMSRYREYENTSIKMGTYYVPAVIKDNSVLISFLRKAEKNYQAKLNLSKNIKSRDVKVFEADATNLKDIKDSAIDFIYTDPPYVDIINYSELNLVWESWLSIHKKTNNEMIVCEQENKSVDYYYKLFASFLKEASRVLKKDGYMVMIFHHPNLSYWGRLQELLLESNFSITLTDQPTRLVSQNKTSSQHKTNKNTQSFIGIILKNEKKSSTNKKLPLLTKKIMEKIKKDAVDSGYISTSEQYDFLINYAINKYDLRGLVFE
jgi:DNA modification methylase